ncbi:flavin reductase family protein [Actinosynnema sp. NPDC023658]|uniref:flavin reductase family protein n=1 Tax=Actinosynnema sp. NPDC023658 TaxID=3155465 RepID=UPI0033DBCE16
MRTEDRLAGTDTRFRDFMTQWPTGVAVITTDDGSAPAGCTVNAMMSLSVRPPALLVSLADGSGTLRAIRRSRAFGVSVLCSRQADLCGRFAAGAQADRFRGVPTHVVRGVPLLSDAAASMVCALRDELAYADHALLVGAPLWHEVDPGNPPLVLHQRAFHALD